MLIQKKNILFYFRLSEISIYTSIFTFVCGLMYEALTTVTDEHSFNRIIRVGAFIKS